MTKQYRVTVFYLGNPRDLTVRAGDARIAAEKGLKEYARISVHSYGYRPILLPPGGSLTINVVRS